jgi:RNA polymerase sigma factor (sigma-70 family)
VNGPWELEMNIHAGRWPPARPDRSPEIRAHEANAQFARIVLPHLDDAYALARWITGNRADAEDVVQESCLRAFRAIGGFAEGNARAWVLTIVRHAAYRWLRKNRPAALVLVEDLDAVEHQQADFAALGVDTPESALIDKAATQRLEAAIAALPTPFREVMVLRDLQGLAYREIAAVTEVPVGTVMSRLAPGAPPADASRRKQRRFALSDHDGVARHDGLFANARAARYCRRRHAIRPGTLHRSRSRRECDRAINGRLPD